MMAVSVHLSSHRQTPHDPAPQDALCVSPVIKFATVVGQDCKHLGALVVTDPEALAEAAAAQGGQCATEPCAARAHHQAAGTKAQRSSSGIGDDCVPCLQARRS
jgi:hypothetical protein